MGAILAVEHTTTHLWNRLWLEKDFKLVVLVFINHLYFLGSKGIDETIVHKHYNSSIIWPDNLTNLNIIFTNYSWLDGIHINELYHECRSFFIKQNES